MNKTFSYLLHGLTLHSEVEFPELMPHPSVTPDVRIRLAALDHFPLHPTHPWQHQFLAQDHALLNIEGVARFAVKGGRKITVDPLPSVGDSTLRLYLLGSSMGCLLHQRGLLPLHANALQFNNECLVFMGQSGSGKSTLAAAMKRRGYKVLADDVCAVNITDGHIPAIFPGVPQIKLWKDAADFLGEDTAPLRRIQPDEEKFALPIDADYCRQACPIKCIYLLDYFDGPEVRIEDLSVLEKIRAIKGNTYRKGMVSKLGIAESHLQASGLLAESVRMKRLLRPRNSLSRIDELMAAIEADLQ